MVEYVTYLVDWLILRYIQGQRNGQVRGVIGRKNSGLELNTFVEIPDESGTHTG